MHRRASRLTSQTQATLQQASRQVLDSEARRQELEEAEQVRVPGPPRYCLLPLAARVGVPFKLFLPPPPGRWVLG